MNILEIENWLRKQPSDVNERGNAVHRIFRPSERYAVDFADGFSAEGWQQYDTDQDAHYFGCWVNPVKFLTITYAEGDWSMVVCSGPESFNAEIQAMNDFYGEGYEFKTIDTDTGTLTIYRQDRNKFFAG